MQLQHPDAGQANLPQQRVSAFEVMLHCIARLACVVSICAASVVFSLLASIIGTLGQDP
jgi:hypothetical protein